MKRKILESVVVEELYSAIERYVKLHGGNIVVIGGIEVQQWPGDLDHNFKIAVKCTGNKPVYEAKP